MRSWALTRFVFEEPGDLVDLLMEMSHRNGDEQDTGGPRHNFFLIPVSLYILLPRFICPHRAAHKWGMGLAPCDPAPSLLF